MLVITSGELKKAAAQWGLGERNSNAVRELLPTVDNAIFPHVEAGGHHIRARAHSSHTGPHTKRHTSLKLLSVTCEIGAELNFHFGHHRIRVQNFTTFQQKKHELRNFFSLFPNIQRLYLHLQKWPLQALLKMPRNKVRLPEIQIAFGLVILRIKVQSKSCERPLPA
jgi:hypothetical protein